MPPEKDDCCGIVMDIVNLVLVAIGFVLGIMGVTMASYDKNRLTIDNDRILT